MMKKSTTPTAASITRRRSSSGITKEPNYQLPTPPSRRTPEDEKRRNALGNLKTSIAAFRLRSVRFLIFNSILDGISYDEIALSISKMNLPKNALPPSPRQVHNFINSPSNFEEFRQVAISQLRIALFTGLARKDKRIQALSNQYYQLDEAIAAMRSSNKYLSQKWALNSILIALHSERRKTLQAIAQEVDPLLNPSSNPASNRNFINILNVNTAPADSSIESTVEEVIDVAAISSSEASDGLARAIAAFAPTNEASAFPKIESIPVSEPIEDSPSG